MEQRSKGNIYYLPIENLEQRYTKMMNDVLSPWCSFTIYPTGFENEVISNGQFLDTFRTIKFKAAQLQVVSDLFNQGTIKNGDVFLVADIFFPGIESIKYMAELSGITVHVYGFNHAGRADDTDFVQRLGKWADKSEQGYHEICDGIFVGSVYHKGHIIDHFNYPEEKIHVTGMVWDIDWLTNVYPYGNDAKEDYCIYPHRLSPEKGTDEFFRVAEENLDIQFIVTCSGKSYSGKVPVNVTICEQMTKKQYYEKMSKARWYLSTSNHENFGYTLQEAILYGCEICVPNRACYPEMVPLRNLWYTHEDIQDFFHAALKGIYKVPLGYTLQHHNNAQRIIQIIQ
jgi:glycosyltransferase involved in cell wall biosynthesis